jgi:acyl-CoA reductase-like NAD-dependent aldehyde dehydrogenase
VAWERRERGGRYYIRSRREKGRVVREYGGTGPFAEIVAATDRTRRELEKAEREQERDRQRRQLERLEALAAPVEELSEAAEVLVRAHLVDAGYHRRQRARGRYSALLRHVLLYGHDQSPLD